MPTFADEKQEKRLLFELDPKKHGKAFTVRAIVAMGGLRPLYFNAPEADFRIQFLSGACQGPVNAAGLRVNGATDFPAPGTTTGYAERGLELRIIHLSHSGRELSQTRQMLNASATVIRDFLPVENLLTPGYGYGPFFRMRPFEYFLPRGETLRIDVRNQDNAAGGNNHRIDIAVLGHIFNE